MTSYIYISQTRKYFFQLSYSKSTLYNKWNVIVHITVGDKQFKCRMYLFLNIKCTSCENATTCIHVGITSEINKCYDEDFQTHNPTILYNII